MMIRSVCDNVELVDDELHGIDADNIRHFWATMSSQKVSCVSSTSSRNGKSRRRLRVPSGKRLNAIMVLNPQSLCLLAIESGVGPTLVQQVCNRFVAFHPSKKRNSVDRGHTPLHQFS